MRDYFCFPVSIIAPLSRVVIYGAGKNGKLLIDKIRHTGIYNIVAVVDQNYKEIITDSSIEVKPTDWLRNNSDYDYIIISLSNKTVQGEIEKKLVEWNINYKKIVNIDIFFMFIPDKTAPLVVNRMNDSQLKIGMYSKYSGLGDQIITLGVYDNLAKIFRDSLIDIWSDQVVFSEAVFEGQNNIGRIIDCKGICLSNEYDKYDLFLEISFELLIKEYNEKKLTSYNKEILNRIKKQVVYQKENYVDSLYNTYSDLILSERARMMGTNRFGLLKGNGLFDEINENVEIKIEEKTWSIFEELKLDTRYITFSYGANGVKKGSKTQTKMWFPEYYKSLFKMIKSQYPSVMIVQLGDREAIEIEGADRYVLGEDLKTVKCILKKSFVHIDCEGGLTHLASHLGTKCIVLFGPTPIWFYGYKNNINICSGICSGCMGINRNYQFNCMKYNRPECMYSITPQMVFDELDKYIKTIDGIK